MSTVIFPLSAQRGVLGMGTLDKDTVSICQTNTAKYLRIRIYLHFQIINDHIIWNQPFVKLWLSNIQFKELKVCYQAFWQ